MEKKTSGCKSKQNYSSDWNLNIRGGGERGRGRGGWGAKLKTFTASLDAQSTSMVLLHPPLQRCSLELLHSLLQHLSGETLTVDYPYKRDESMIAEGCNLNPTHLLHIPQMPNYLCAVLCFFYFLNFNLWVGKRNLRGLLPCKTKRMKNNNNKKIEHLSLLLPKCKGSKCL